MATRVQVGVQVPKMELLMPDGTMYTWAIDMLSVERIQERHDQNAFDYLRRVIEDYAEHPISSYIDVMHLGLMSYHPELTREDVARLFPATRELLEQMAQKLGEALPDIDPANPTMPGRPNRQTRRNRKGAARGSTTPTR